MRLLWKPMDSDGETAFLLPGGQALWGQMMLDSLSDPSANGYPHQTHCTGRKLRPRSAGLDLNLGLSDSKSRPTQLCLTR